MSHRFILVAMPRFNTPEKAYAEAERVIEEARRAGDVALSLTSLGLEELPESLGQLTQLQFLFVSYNQLSALPEWIRQLTQLRILNVSGNRLKTLPTSLQQLEESGTLRELYLHNNYDLNIPLEILGCKWHERSEKQPADPREILRYYFSQQRAGNAHPLNEAKVLFIGESEVGKSSLIAALAHGKFKQSFDKTRGIVREKWMVPEADNLRLNLWDFGGQEVYHSTHTFFLTERALYVVVVNARDNDRQNNIEYWLQMARSFGGDAPILVAINKCDQHGAGPDENLLRRKYGGNLEFIRTSCHSGEGLPSLKKAILARIAGLPEVRREIPDAWLRLKDELEAMTQDTLPVSAYRALCVRCGESDEANQNLLLDLWHKLGTVLYFHHDDEDEEDMSALGILNPDWVTRGVYAVLDDKELMNRQGLLTKKQLAETLRRAKYQGDDPDFIEAMMR
ncbi:MAG TPA: COR domain-containing protein, partial [Abditibacteriaceae bacterium]